MAYQPIVHNDFVNYDDPEYIGSNRSIHSGLSWKTVEWAFRSTEQGNWHPITWLSHALDYQLFRLNPVGHHYVGVLLHALTAILLFLFLRASTGFIGRNFTVAALFAVHPLNVESVAWASERKSVLCMLFFVLTLLAYRWYTQQPNWQRYSSVVLLLALGLMSKPMLVTLPFVLLLLDYWPLGRTGTISSRRLAMEKLPLMFLSIASCAITVFAQNAHRAIHSSDFTFLNRLQNAIVSYLTYLGKALWPVKLAGFYPHPQHLPWWQVGLALLLLSFLSMWAFHARERRYWPVGWLWFLGTMVPVVGIVQVGEQGMADRYVYLPLVGFFIAVVWAAAEWAHSRGISLVYPGVIACALIAACVALTNIQVRYWKNTKTLWTHTLAVTKGNYVAEASLGAELISEGELRDAIIHLRNGISINPRDPFSHLDLGVCEKRLGNTAEAVHEYQAALSLASDPALRGTAYGNLGSIYRVAGNYFLAIRNYNAALEISPDDAVSLTGLGLISQKMGNLDSAVKYFARLNEVRPSDYGFLLLSQALAKAGRAGESQAAYVRAQSLSANWNGTLAMVGHLLQE